jgi:hypothetical protein
MSYLRCVYSGQRPANELILSGDMGGMMSGVMSLGKNLMNQNSGAREKTKQTKTSPADVIMWSGCKDSQTVSGSPTVSIQVHIG